MKSKKQLIEDSKSYFKKYPKDNKVLTIGDGNFFLESNKSAAKTYAKQNKKDLITITREDAGVESDAKTADSKKAKTSDTKKDEVVIPEGDPSKSWTKDELIAYGQREYPDLKLTKRMSEDTILDNLAEAFKAKEPKE
jgi:hypothetical protein